MMRPKPRPEGMMKKKKKSNAPMKSIRPKARPPMATEAEIAAADRANKTVDRINKEGIPGMKAGGMMKKKGYAKGGMYGETATEKQMKMKKKGYAKGGMMKKGYKKGGKMPDLTGDGKVTQADVLKGRGVFKKGGMAKKGYAKGGMMKKGYKKGGKVRGAGIARKGVRPAKMM
tara:strand:+ start:1886 stop:2404 length:519 start_codon:yes stop_codon:yes gene_type:complete